MSRQIKHIVLHCTASWQTATLKDILKEFHDKGWENPGYHHIIFPDGKIENTLPIDKIANGVANHNANSIHISYVGGIERKDGKIIAIDNRTEKQIQSMIYLIESYKFKYPNAVVCGHRDFSKDLDGDGVIESHEWIKQCPCFDVASWLKGINRQNSWRPTKIVYKLNYPAIKDEKVKDIQEPLKIKKFYKGIIDGWFGTNTDLAVKAFQKSKGLQVTGIVDEATQKALGITL